MQAPPPEIDSRDGLREIFRAEGLIAADADLPAVDWTDFTANDREIRPGKIFVAIRGAKFDGHAKVADALRAGASAVLVDAISDAYGNPTAAGWKNDPRIVRVRDTRVALAFLAAAREGFPTRAMKVFGVTGTSGKTTTTYILEALLKKGGHRVGLIGTVEIRIDGKRIPSTHTTPGPEDLQRVLREMREAGCTAVVMEVSSHALYQSRVAGVFFDGLGFTNLSAEHLDFHSTLDDYFEAKRELFGREWDRSVRYGAKGVRGAIVRNEWGKKLFDGLPESKRDASILLDLPRDLALHAGGLRATFDGIRIESPLVGPFNAENILLASRLAVDAGVPPLAIAEGVRELRAVPGRLEAVPDPIEGRVVLVDYAHKPDALEKVLRTLRNLVVAPNRLLTVIGCGGDRDRQKRPVMAAIAERYSDHVFLTSDNPRTEDPERILDEMESGVTARGKITRDSDRRSAIGRAIETAIRGDWILIAGKGHETYQIVGGETLPFDDRAVAREFLETS